MRTWIVGLLDCWIVGLCLQLYLKHFSFYGLSEI
jgi:hypothetical protein